MTTLNQQIFPPASNLDRITLDQRIAETEAFLGHLKAERERLHNKPTQAPRHAPASAAEYAEMDAERWDGLS